MANEDSVFRMHRRVLAACVLVSHMVFVGVVLGLSWRGDRQLYLTPDSATYVRAAHNILEHGAFSGEAAAPFAWEPYRLPGYPALIAASLALNGREWPVLFLAPLLAAVGALAMMTLVWRLFPSVAAVDATGVLSAVFPNSLGLSAFLLTDAVGGFLFVVAIVVGFLAIEKACAAEAGISAAAWAACQLIRPTFALAAGFVVLTAVLIARTQRQWVTAAVLCAATIPVPLWLSHKNFQAHGVFTPSLLGTRTAREYLFARVETGALGREYNAHREIVRREEIGLARAQSGAQSWYGALHSIEKKNIDGIVRLYGWAAVGKQYAIEAVKQLLAPWDSFTEALTGSVGRFSRVVLGVLSTAFLGLAIAGSWLVARAGNGRVLILIWGAHAFFLASGAVSTQVGSRLRFPSELLLVPLTAAALCALARSVKGEPPLTSEAKAQ